jgi:2-polyprenyl-3-methyl-5-hydroxy-6-metoxy-1,4-benzoquinol methylase
VPRSVIPRVYLTDPNLRPQTRAHHIARYEFAGSSLRGDCVLDVMCGSGYGANILREHGARVIGFDADKDAITFARSSYPRCIFSLSTAQDITLPVGFFTGITWFEGIEHITKGEACDLLSRCADALMPGGTLILSTPRDTNEKYNPWHVSTWTLPQLRAAVLEEGFSRVYEFGQDWDTAEISMDNVADNDFYILVCRK